MSEEPQDRGDQDPGPDRGDDVARAAIGAILTLGDYLGGVLARQADAVRGPQEPGSPATSAPPPAATPARSSGAEGPAGTLPASPVAGPAGVLAELPPGASPAPSTSDNGSLPVVAGPSGEAPAEASDGPSEPAAGAAGSDGSPSSGAGDTARHLVVGAAFTGQRQARRALGAALGAVGAAGRRVAPVAAPVARALDRGPVRDAREAVRDGIAHLVEVGREEEQRSRALVTGTVNTIANEATDAIVDIAFPPAYDRAIIEVAQSPEVKAIVREQSGSMLSNVADSVRSRAVLGDDSAEKVARTFFRPFAERRRRKAAQRSALAAVANAMIPPLPGVPSGVDVGPGGPAAGPAALPEASPPVRGALGPGDPVAGGGSPTVEGSGAPGPGQP